MITMKETEFKLIDSDDYFDLFVQSYKTNIITGNSAYTFFDEDGKELGNPALVLERIYDDNFNLIIPIKTREVKMVKKDDK